jgi:hypothetical protein
MYMKFLQSGAPNCVPEAQQVLRYRLVVSVSTKKNIHCFFHRAFFSLPNATHVSQTSKWVTNLTCICFELISHEVPTILWYNSVVKYPTYYSFCFLSWSGEEGNGSQMHNLNKKLDKTLYFKHSKSKFSQNATNLLSKWRHVSTQAVIIRPIIEPCMRYIKWKCTFMGSKNNILVHIFGIPKRHFVSHFWDPKTTFWDPKNVHFHLM